MQASAASGEAEELVARAGLLFAEDDLDGARLLLEQAFVALRDRDDVRAAARIAAQLSELHTGPLGNAAVGRGWVERGRRLLDGVDPCVELGYLELAALACDRPDVDGLAASAARALELARRFGDVGLEVRALADGALALVTQGRVGEGFARLDEALATLSAGEVRDPRIVGTSLCSLLSSCDRAGDLDRAAVSVRLVESLVLEPGEGRPKLLGTHCRLALGAALCATGRWDEGEAALLEAIGPGASATRNHRTEALARLAELRVHQGRTDEAAELLVEIEDALPAAGPLALVHLRRGEPGLAAAVLRNAVKRMVGDVLRAGPLLLSLVGAELACGRPDAAADAAVLLHSMARATDSPCAAALASIADGRVALAAGDAAAALAAYDAALDRLQDGGQRPLLMATVHLERAAAHRASGSVEDAVVAARAAHAVAQRLGAAAVCDEAAALLRQLGSPVPRPAPRADRLRGLTARELEVLACLQRGDTNAEIAARLYLSPKTVEHHVGRILSKLGVRTRAEAAALAARSGI